MILVTGATGAIGHPLVDMLHSAGVAVRAVTRNAKAARLPAAVEIVEGNPANPATIQDSLRDVVAVVLNPRAIGTAAEELVALARDAGVARLVAISALNVDWSLDRQPSRLRGEYNKEVEAAVVASGLEWAALRSGWYAGNAIGMYSGQVRAGDVVRGPHAAASWAPLDERDIAAVATRALLTDELLGSRPELTGPELLDQHQMVAAIGAATGRPLRFEEVPPEVAIQDLIRTGIPESAARGFVRLQGESYGQGGLVTGEVERILGRPGTTFAQWAADHAAAFGGHQAGAR